MKKILKLLIVALFVTVMSFTMESVKAYTLTAQDIVKYINGLDKLGSRYRLVANGNTIKFYREDELIESLDIDGDYIEYIYVEDQEPDPDNIIKYMIVDAYKEHMNLISDAFEVNPNFKNTQNYTEEYRQELYNIYGIYEYSVLDDEQNITTVHIKFSLDTDKHNKLFMDAFILKSDLTDEEKAPYLVTPKLAYEDLKKNKVTIFPSNFNTSIFPESNYCHVYRSEEENGEYIKITDKKVICNGEYGVIDDTLTPGKTYYYKARMVYTNILSDTLVVTTPDGVTTTTKNIQTTTTHETTTALQENPKTGVSSHIVLSMIVASIGIVLIILLKRKKPFEQI